MSCEEQMDCPSEIYQKDYGTNGTNETVSFNLIQGLKPGHVITVVAQSSKIFEINIKDSSGNFLLHFTPRFNDKAMVLNSYFGGWGEEERPKFMPIKKGERFCFTCHYEVEGYRTYVNGEEFTFYKHRSSNQGALCQIMSAQVFKVSYGKGKPRWLVNNTIKKFGPRGITLPYTFYLPQHCQPGTWITIIGLVNNDAKYMGVDIRNADDDILFHFNPRYADNCIVRNSFLLKKWGTEEKNGGLPIPKGRRFTFSIVIETTCYRLYINGEEFKTYNHRAVLSEEMTVKIEGDFIVYEIICQQ